MENRAHALVVGLFALLLGAAALAAFWWFSGGAQDTERYMIVARQSVAGLNPQAAVRYRGVRVGKVIEVDLRDSLEVHVLIRVDASVPITRATRARIASQGLTGQGFVVLDDDGSDPAPVRSGPAGSPPVIPMQATAAQGDSPQDLMARLRHTTERLDQVLSAENVGRINQTLENLAASSASLEKALAQTAALAADMRRFSAPENAERLASTLQRIEQMSGQLTPAVEDFRRAVGRVEAAGQRIDRAGAAVQQGLAGEALPRFAELMGELQASSQQLNLLLDDLTRQPQSLLGGRAQQAGPGEERNP